MKVKIYCPCSAKYEFEIEPVPVQVVYQQARLVTSKVRGFVDECVSKLRQVPFD